MLEVFYLHIYVDVTQNQGGNYDVFPDKTTNVLIFYDLCRVTGFVIKLHDFFLSTF